MKKVLNRVVTVLLVVCLLLSGGLVSSLAVDKKQTSRTIGIVFDNSGSMYMDGELAWCRATYAIEVIAAMMNDGDVMQVYPMKDIQVGGQTYSQTKPLVVNGPSEAGKIREIYTPKAGDTPLEAVDAAYNGLKQANTDEKWLILLTDGSNFYQNEAELSVSETKNVLSRKLSGYTADMNTMYLGIGSGLQAPEIKSSTAYLGRSEVASDSKAVLSKLTEMCNVIFGRDALPISGNSVDFDLTMSKLIVFVQGSSISNVTLTDGSGKALGGQTGSYSARYSEKGAGNPSYTIKADTSLQGQMVTYSNLDAGHYTLQYSGDMSSVSVYFEPDVDLKLMLVDENGREVTPGTNYAGEYTLAYTMVDRDGKETTSSLLGNVSCDLTTKLSGVESTVQTGVPGAIPFDLKAGDTLDGSATVSFLSGYSITRSFEDMGWPGNGIEITPRPAGTLEASVRQGPEEVKLSNVQESSLAEVNLLYEGGSLTAEQMQNAEVQVELEGGNAEFVVEESENGLKVSLVQPDDPDSIECGEYVLRLTPSYINEEGQLAQGEPVEIAFTLVDDSRGLEVKTEAAQSYYQISKMDEGEPLMVYLTRQGEKLTPEELDATVLNVDTEGLDYTVTKNYEESAYEVHLKKDENAKAGNYKVTTSVTTVDEVGRLLTQEDSAGVELQPYPAWLRTVVILLGVLLLGLIIFLILNHKVLPNKILTPRCTFTVDGEAIPGNVITRYNRKAGTLDVTSPHYAGNAAVKCGYRLKLKANSPRRIRSANRSVLVTDIAPLNAATQNVSIGAVSMLREEETNKFIRAGGRPLQPFEMNSNARTSALALVNDMDGGELEVFLSTNLKFK